MRKSRLAVFITASLGIIGIFIRAYHYKTGYDAAGLPAGNFADIFFNFYIAALALMTFVLSVIKTSRYSPEPVYTEAFGYESYFSLVIQMLSALVFIVGAAFCLRHQLLTAPLTRIGLFGAIVIAAGGISGCVGVILMALSAYQGKHNKAAGFLMIGYAAVFVLSLFGLYTPNEANPTVISYSPDCIAVSGACLYGFLAAGYALNKQQSFITMFSGLITIAFAPMSIFGKTTETGVMIILLASYLFTLPGIIPFLGNMKRKKKKEN